MDLLEKANKDSKQNLSIGFGTGITTMGQLQEATERQEDEELFQRYRENLKPREGGIADRPPSHDGGGLTNQGISTPTLNLLRRHNSALPDRTTGLSDDKITNIFREEYFYRPQINKLARVKGLEQADSKLAEHVFDSAILHGDLDAGEWLQRSIDKVTGSNLKENGLYDGIMGSKTRQAVERAVQQGKIKDVHKNFIDLRRAYMRDHSDYLPNKGGWENRVNDFEKAINR